LARHAAGAVVDLYVGHHPRRQPVIDQNFDGLITAHAGGGAIHHGPNMCAAYGLDDLHRFGNRHG
jgi:hypothetical protein